MNWEKTTLRKGTKKPRVCSDMFITDSRGTFQFFQMKNAQIVLRKRLSTIEAEALIKEHDLVPTGSCFAKCFTYRDKESTKLVSNLLKVKS